MSPQRPIHLCEVINRVWKYHCKGQDAFRTLVDRRAAGLAASRDEEPINDAQRALLRDVAERRLAIADLRERDEDAHFAMRRCSGVARAQLLGDDGLEPQGEIVWETVRQWVFDRVRIPVTNNMLEEYAGLGSLRARSNADDLCAEMNKLDAEGATDDLLHVLRQAHRSDISAMKLPKITSQAGAAGYAPDEMTLTDAALKWDIPKPEWSKAAAKGSNEPGHLRTRQIGRNRLVTKRHAQKFATDYLARREQRIVGSKSTDRDRGLVVSALENIKKKAKPYRQEKPT